MILMQCENGHYYDPEKSSTCPWCENNVEADGRQLLNRSKKIEPYNYSRKTADTEPVTEPVTDPVTEPVTEPVSISVTEPVNEADTLVLPEPVTGWLVAMTGPHRGQDFRIVQERNFLGRGEHNQICLEYDQEVSRNNHCSVIYDPRSGKFVALAGDSTATKLNNETLLSSAELHDGDILSIGKTDLCFISFCREGRNWK